MKKTCPICKQEFVTNKGKQITCSRTCGVALKRTHYVSPIGAEHPTWKGGKEKIECAVCGKVFYKWKSQMKKTCSKKCWIILKQRQSQGYKNPSWKGGKATKVCLHCNRKFMTPVSYNAKYCSLSCFASHRIGKRNSNWRGGAKYELYPKAFYEAREAVLQRDKYTCQLCGAGGNQVHHVNYDKHDNDDPNLVTLCIYCHMTTNYNRDFWQWWFTDCPPLKRWNFDPFAMMDYYAHIFKEAA